MKGCGSACSFLTVKTKSAVDISQITFYGNEKEWVTMGCNEWCFSWRPRRLLCLFLSLWRCHSILVLQESLLAPGTQLKAGDVLRAVA